MLELFVQLFKAVLQLFLALLNPIFLRFCMFCAVNCLDIDGWKRTTPLARAGETV